MDKSKKVCIILRPTIKDEFKTVVVHLLRWFSKRNVAVCFSLSDREKIKKYFPQMSFKDQDFCFPNKISDCDFLLSLGGDGTLIGLCRQVKTKTPIFGVNWGRLGFITEFNSQSMYENLTRVLNNDYTLVKKPLYNVKILHNEKVIFKERFINDVVISRHDISRLFHLKVECENESLLQLAGDGLIISTPIGSTAYSLAAGGPVVHPDVEAMLMTPICPHGLLHRPIVVPNQFKIKVSLAPQERPVVLTVDGQVYHDIDTSHQVVISRNKNENVYFIANEEKTYFHTLKEKFVHNLRS